MQKRQNILLRSPTTRNMARNLKRPQSNDTPITGHRHAPHKTYTSPRKPASGPIRHSRTQLYPRGASIFLNGQNMAQTYWEKSWYPCCGRSPQLRQINLFGLLTELSCLEITFAILGGWLWLTQLLDTRLAITAENRLYRVYLTKSHSDQAILH